MLGHSFSIHFTVFAAALQSVYVLRGNIFWGCLFPFPAWFAFICFFAVRCLFLPAKRFCPSNGEILVRHVRLIFSTEFVLNILTAIIRITCIILTFIHIRPLNPHIESSHSFTKVISYAMFIFLCAEFSQHTRARITRDGAMFSKNSTFVFFHGANATSENGI